LMMTESGRAILRHGDISYSNADTLAQSTHIALHHTDTLIETGVEPIGAAAEMSPGVSGEEISILLRVRFDGVKYSAR
jgi:hypothetical protein